MNAIVRDQLIALNARFYQEFATSFSSTRLRLQPGVERILLTLPLDSRLLDLGCGNGELARRLTARGFEGVYVGIDFSAPLLVFTSPEVDQSIHFILSDLSSPTWDAALPPQPFDAILSFAVLHHLPGADLRLRLLQQARLHLAPGGRFIHSEWQFHHSPRLTARILPWETIGLTVADVDPGDTLLDWRQDGHGLRYVHLFNEEELSLFARSGGFTIQDSFYSDGRSGDLALYQVWG